MSNGKAERSINKLISPRIIPPSPISSSNNGMKSSLNSDINSTSQNNSMKSTSYNSMKSTSYDTKPIIIKPSIKPPLNSWNVHEQPIGHYGVKQPTIIDKIYGSTNSKYNGDLNIPSITITKTHIKWETSYGHNSTYNKQNGTWNNWTW